MRFTLLLPTILLVFPTVSPADVDFEKDVAPLISKRCLECHNSREKSGGLVLETQKSTMKGGESGVVVVAKNVNQSALIQRIVDGEMPPQKQGESQALPAAEIAVFKEWVKSGAAWPAGRTIDLYESTNDVRGGRDWWSFQPVKRHPLPPLSDLRQVSNGIDHFVLAKLMVKNMQPAPEADRRTLIRRAYYSVIGLPPTYEQVEAFVADESNNAWEKVVDGLLKSPHFGERWARYWLDLVRYAETSGYERDQEKPFAWRYRDWVVDAINNDLPYDQFITQQLAGDEMPNRNEQSAIGTGFLRLGTWNDEPNDPQDYKYERLEDLVHVTSSAFLGLTVKCARCHDHKFDPIPQDDYYRVASAFWAGSIEPRTGKLLGGPTKQELGFDRVLGWTDVSTKPSPLHLLKKGNRHAPGAVVEPASLTLVPAMFRQFDGPAKDAKTTGRRLQLAKWIVDPKNPLTARVFVNRIWQHHFGQGIVRSPNNFGFRGAKPTHPQLLDWLASELTANGWKPKRIHKLILMSSTWRQSSLHPKRDDYDLRDSGNSLWWRAERRRLDAEALRDSMLAATDELDRKLGGVSFRPTISRDALEGLSRKSSAWTASPKEQQMRRSLYIYMKRHLLPPIMTTFDLHDTTLPCGQRDVTTVPTQALAMLNNAFPHDRSSALSTHIAGQSDNVNEQILLAWRMALGRNPTADELQLSRQHLKSQQKNFLAPTKTKSGDDWRKAKSKISTNGLVLHLRADSGVKLEDGRVATWQNLAGSKHGVHQSVADRRPILVKNAINGQPAIRFDGQRRFLHIDGKLLSSANCTMFAVVTDTTKHNRHRGILSNWAGRQGNSTSSIFLGLTKDSTVRFSDAFGAAGNVSDRTKPFLLTASNGASGTFVWQNGSLLAHQGQLTGRKLDFPWVIGQQGNIDGEYWNGDLAEIIVYDRELTLVERRAVWNQLLGRYQLVTSVDVKPTTQPPDRKLLPLASLCHVLLNCNEFLYVD